MRIKEFYLVITTGLVFFITLGYLSIVFYQERCLNFDSAWFAFKIIHFKSFNIELARFPSVLTQYLPLFAVKYHLSLPTVLKLYSINFVLNQFLVFLLITFFLKSNKAALALLLALCLAWRGEFYYMSPEFPQALLYGIILYAFIEKISGINKATSNLLLTAAALITVLVTLKTHLLSVFFVFFIPSFEIIRRKEYRNKYLIAILFFVVFAYAFLRYFIPMDAYEETKMLPLSSLSMLLPDILNYPGTNYLIQFLMQHLWSFLFVAFFLTFSLLKKRQIALTAFVLAGPTLYIIIVLLSFHKGHFPFMYENYFVALGFFFAIPFINEFYTSRHKILFYVSYILILVLNIAGIYKSHADYTDRLGYVKRITHAAQNTENGKMIINANNFPWQKTGWAAWALPFESLLFSALESPVKAASCIVEEKTGMYDSIMSRPGIFLGPPWAPERFNTTAFNRGYFIMSNSPYIKANSSQKDPAFHEELFSNHNVSITFANSTLSLSCGERTMIPLMITNLSNFPIHSLPDAANSVYVGYRIISPNGKVVKRTNCALENDILGVSEQGLLIIAPEEKGTYRIEVDMLTENKRQWGINTSIELIVK